MKFLENALLAPVYYAGLFDGEGSVGLYRMGVKQRTPNGYPVISAKLTNTVREPLDWLLENRGGSIQSNKGSSKNVLWLDAYSWRVYAENAIDFLLWIEPYAIIKKQQICEIKEFWAYYQPYKQNKYDRPDKNIVDHYIQTLKDLKRG